MNINYHLTVNVIIFPQKSEEEFSPNEVIPEYDPEDDEEGEGSGDSEVLTRDGATIELGSGDGLEATEGVSLKASKNGLGFGLSFSILL